MDTYDLAVAIRYYWWNINTFDYHLPEATCT